MLFIILNCHSWLKSYIKISLYLLKLFYNNKHKNFICTKVLIYKTHSNFMPLKTKKKEQISPSGHYRHCLRDAQLQCVRDDDCTELSFRRQDKKPGLAKQWPIWPTTPLRVIELIRSYFFFLVFDRKIKNFLCIKLNSSIFPNIY